MSRKYFLFDYSLEFLKSVVNAQDTVCENRRLVYENEVLGDAVDQLRAIKSKMDVNEAREKRELKDRNVELENEIELRQQQVRHKFTFQWCPFSLESV